MRRRLGRLGTTFVAAALFVSMSGISAANANGYGYSYGVGYGYGGHHSSYPYGHGYYRHSYSHRGHYRHGHRGHHRSGAAIIIPALAIGVGALLYLNHKANKHRHHHHHDTCHNPHVAQNQPGCGYGPATAPYPAPQGPSSGSVSDRLAGGPTTPVTVRNASDSPLVVSNAPCKPVKSTRRGADGRREHYQAILCYYTNGTAFIEPGSTIRVAGAP